VADNQDFLCVAFKDSRDDPPCELVKPGIKIRALSERILAIENPVIHQMIDIGLPQQGLGGANQDHHEPNRDNARRDVRERQDEVNQGRGAVRDEQCGDDQAQQSEVGVEQPGREVPIDPKQSENRSLAECGRDAFEQEGASFDPRPVQIAPDQILPAQHFVNRLSTPFAVTCSDGPAHRGYRLVLLHRPDIPLNGEALRKSRELLDE